MAKNKKKLEARELIVQIELERHELVESRQTNLIDFIKFLFPSEYQSNWHHEVCCGVFDKFARNEINRLMVFMPPQHGKSTMMTEYLPAQLLGLNPDEKIILCGYNAELAAKFNRKIQRVIDSDKYRQIFPNTTLAGKNGASKGEIRNSSEFEIVGHDGSLRVAGVGGGIASYPAYTALLDDVIKNNEEAYSRTYRKKLYEWYTDELEARLHNNSKVAFTITRRHEDDLAGRLLDRDGTVEEGGKWTVVKFPAIKEDNDNPDDPREIGEALWPERHSLERIEYIREKNARTFASLYQQRPAPLEGGIIKRNWFGWYDPKDLNIIRPRFYADTAYTKNTSNDPTALLASEFQNGYLYLIDCAREWLEYPELIEWVPRWVRANYYSKSSIVKVEPKATGKSIVQSLKKDTDLNIVEYKNPTTDKESRAYAATIKIESARVLLPKGADWVEGFLQECCSFPNAKHDDRVDCLVMAIDDNFNGNEAMKMIAGQPGTNKWG